MKTNPTRSKLHIREMMRYVQVVPNIVPPELCDAILEEYVHSPTWEHARVGDGSVSSFRNCSVTHIGKHKAHKNWEALDSAMYDCSVKAINAYRDVFPDCNIEEDSGYDILRYTKGGYYNQHVDSFMKIPRAVSCSFAMNENFEGGEWCFFDNLVKMRVNKGEAVMFPSNFMFPHAIAPVKEGTRYSIITWFI